MNRFAIAAMSLLCSAACIAQTNALGNAPSGSSQPQVFYPPPIAGDNAGNTPARGTEAPVAVFNAKEYRVGANDLLDIEVLNLDNGKRTVRVNAAGAITMPLVGVINVAGLTQQEVEAHIAGVYGEKYLQDPQVSVFIREYTTERITVDGAVAKPGIYPLVGQMTLLRALALAGGFGQIANAREVKVFRRGENGKREVSTFDVEKIRSGSIADPEVRGDDLVVVQRDSTRAVLKDSVFRDVLDYLNPFSIFTR